MLVFLNGRLCKDTKDVTSNDFFHSIPKPPSQPVSVSPVGVDQIPGLNTLGLFLVRFDLGTGGQIAPHTHPRASEIVFVQEGTIEVGFVTSSTNTLFSKTLNPGDVFVFPVGLIHYLVNVGKTPAVAFAVLNSQNPGVVSVASSVFGSKPAINPDSLAKAFQLDVDVVKGLQAKFGGNN